MKRNLAAQIKCSAVNRTQIPLSASLRRRSLCFPLSLLQTDSLSSPLNILKCLSPAATPIFPFLRLLS